LDGLSDKGVLARYFAASDAKDRDLCVDELFRRHYPKVVSWCLRFAGDREDAHDLAQAIFTNAYRHLGSFRGDSTLTTWLYSITRSECMTFLGTRRDRLAPAEPELEEVLDDAPGPDQALEAQMSIRWVKAFLDKVLDETEKKIFILHYGDDVPLDAITRLLGLENRSGAKAYIVRARRKIARALRTWKPCDQAAGA
jgi:RNA polymerase sigma-70 factor, ECF subfamily